MNQINELLKYVEANPVTGTAILTLAVTGVIGIFKSILSCIFKKLSKESLFISPKFWSQNKKFHILHVHEFFPSDDPSGFKQKQNSRSDLWDKIIYTKSSFFGFRHEIIPYNKDSILCISIKINDKEKIININRYV